MAEGVLMLDAFRGVAPFRMSVAVRVTLIVLCPSIALMRPHVLAN